MHTQAPLYVPVLLGLIGLSIPLAFLLVWWCTRNSRSYAGRTINTEMKFKGIFLLVIIVVIGLGMAFTNH